MRIMGCSVGTSRITPVSRYSIPIGAARPAEGTTSAGTYMRLQGESGVWVVTDYTTRNIFKKVEDLVP